VAKNRQREVNRSALEGFALMCKRKPGCATEHILWEARPREFPHLVVCPGAYLRTTPTLFRRSRPGLVSVPRARATTKGQVRFEVAPRVARSRLRSSVSLTGLGYEEAAELAYAAFGIWALRAEILRYLHSRPEGGKPGGKLVTQRS